MRDELQRWRRFIRAQTYVLRTEPRLLFQQAANSGKNSAQSRAASRRIQAGIENRQWLKQLNQPRVSSCMLMSVSKLEAA